MSGIIISCLLLGIIRDEGSTLLRKTGEVEELIHKFSHNADVSIQYISDDPDDPDFTAFHVIDEGVQLCCFRARNIVDMHKFRIAIGGKCLETNVKHSSRIKNTSSTAVQQPDIATSPLMESKDDMFSVPATGKLSLSYFDASKPFLLLQV